MLEWLLFLAITLGGAMVPGANLAIVLRNTLSGSLRAGILTVMGLASALLIHGSLSLLGITALIQQSPALFEAIRWFGAGYLLLLGLLQLLQRGADASQEAPARGGPSPYLSGLLISLFNPKVLIFFLAIFAQVLHPEQSLAEQLLYVATPALAEISWFTLLLTLLARPAIRARLMRLKRRLEQLVGGALIALGLKLGLG
jgi:threonine/homoserine/homoserine lactone efflux protein